VFCLPVVQFAPDGQRRVEVLQCLFPLPQVVIGFAHVVQRIGFGLTNSQRAPNRQRLVEQCQRLVFLAEVRIDPAHGVLSHGLCRLVARSLLDRQNGVQVFEGFLRLPCLPVHHAQEIQFRRLFPQAPGGSRRSQLLLMLGDLILQ